MKVNKSGVFGGIMLIVFGALALAGQMGYLGKYSGSLWPWIFAFISVAGFLGYAFSGWQEWGWLFPAGVFGGLAVTVAMALNDVDGAGVASPLFVGLLIPFAAAYFTDRARNWWALIPGGFMLFLAMTTLLVDNFGGEWIGSMFLFLIGLSFFIVWFGNRSRQWALLVAYILFVLSVAPAMASFGGDAAAYFGAVFLLAVGLPFFILYFREKKNWWAIIPAGVMTTLSILTAFAIAGRIANANEGGYANAFLMFGLAVTFAVVWLRHAISWAKVVTVALVVLAVASLFFVSYSQLIWPVATILMGGYLLFNALRPKPLQP